MLPHRYSLCDVNDDGVISGQEVNAWGEIHKALNGDATADVEKCARAIFSLVDKNGDGEVRLIPHGIVKSCVGLSTLLSWWTCRFRKMRLNSLFVSLAPSAQQLDLRLSKLRRQVPHRTHEEGNCLEWIVSK